MKERLADVIERSSGTLYEEWLRSEERFKLHYDQWLEKQVRLLRDKVKWEAKKETGSER